jgi:ribose transport system permease protein
MRLPNLSTLINAAGPFFGLLAVIAFFSLDPDVRQSFLTGGNFKIILTQTVIVAIAAIGMTLIIVSGGIDLSVGSVVALTSVVAARLLSLDNPCSPLFVTFLTILTGAFIGLVNGCIIAGIRMMPFIVTLGMMGIARGTAKWLGDSQTVNVPNLPAHQDAVAPLLKLMAMQRPFEFLPVPLGVWITLLLAAAMALVLRQTVFGRHLFAIGSNEATARLCGIRVQWRKVMIYALGGAFAGLAGLMQFSRLNQGDPTVAIGLELDIIAAVVIGGASLSGGTGSILGSMIGALIMAVLRNGSNQMDWPTYRQEIIIGCVIIFAVALDRWRQSRARQNPSAPT